ncbi:M23 family metallopeptidase [Deltaproteobacteria bacterium TL4]
MKHQIAVPILKAVFEVFIVLIFLCSTLHADPSYIIPPVDGEFEVSKNINAYCPGTSSVKWCFWQWKCQTSPSTHCPNNGIDNADDTYAFDINLLNDAENGKPVYAIADGKVYRQGMWGGSSYGQILISHTDTNGFQWSSGYVHLRDIPSKFKIDGTLVRQGDVLGYISNIGVDGTNTTTGNPHLHFAVYNSHGKNAFLNRYKFLDHKTTRCHL